MEEAYMTTATRQIRKKRWPAATVIGVVGLGLVVGTVYAGAPAPDSKDRVAPSVAEVGVPEGRAVWAAPADVGDLARRIGRVNTAWADLASYYEAKVAPIQRVLMRYRDDVELTNRIAVALVREAKAVGLEPRLLLAVLLVENPWLDPEIRSPVGAIGLMQVMPLHRGAWGCGTDLEDVDVNVCHGARIFAHYFRATDGNVDRALLRYNGCVRGTNTPNCHQYPYHVFARAGRASVLAWLDRPPVAGVR
jgi:soluble lytic murein transglycosylase-like protein